MKTFSFLTSFLCLFLLSFAVQAQFQVTAGNNAANFIPKEGRQVPKTQRFLTVGTTSFNGADRITITLYDATGSVISHRYIQDILVTGMPTHLRGEGFDFVSSTNPTQSDLYIVGTRQGVQSFVSEMVVLRVTLGGTIVWARRIDNGLQGQLFSDAGVSIETQPNGDVIAVGTGLGMTPTGVTNHHQIVARFDAAGNLLWANRYFSTAGANLRPQESCNGFRASSAHPTGKQELIAVTGMIDNVLSTTPVVHTAYISTIDANTGIEVWRRSYIVNNAYMSSGLDIVQQQSNAASPPFTAVGETVFGNTSSVLVINANSNSGAGSAAVYSIPNKRLGARGVCIGGSSPNANNRLMLTGYCSSFSAIPGTMPANNIFLMQLPYAKGSAPSFFHLFDESTVLMQGSESVKPTTTNTGARNGYLITGNHIPNAYSGSGIYGEHVIRTNNAGLTNKADCDTTGLIPIITTSNQSSLLQGFRIPISSQSFSPVSVLHQLSSLKCDGTPPAPLVAQEQTEMTGEVLMTQPNPARNGLPATVKWANDIEATAIAVFDTHGRMIVRASLEAGTNEHTLDVLGWVPGLYIVRLETAGGYAMTKLMVE